MSRKDAVEVMARAINPYGWEHPDMKELDTKGYGQVMRKNARASATNALDALIAHCPKVAEVLDDGN